MPFRINSPKDFESWGEAAKEQIQATAGPSVPAEASKDPVVEPGPADASEATPRPDDATGQGPAGAAGALARVAGRVVGRAMQQPLWAMLGGAAMVAIVLVASLVMVSARSAAAGPLTHPSSLGYKCHLPSGHIVLTHDQTSCNEIMTAQAKTPSTTAAAATPADQAGPTASTAATAAPLTDPVTPDWSAIEAAAAPDVFRVESYTCLPGTLAGCSITFQGTGFFVAMPGWSCTGTGCTMTVPNPTPAPVLAISAYHMACDPLLTHWISRMTWLDSQGRVIFTRTATTRSGLCNESDEVAGVVLGSPADDVGVWAADVWRGLPVATKPPAVGDPVAVLGNPGGMSTGAPIATTGHVLGTDLAFEEAPEYGLPARHITGAIELAVDAYPGNSGSPVLNAQGQVIGTLVAGGPQSQGNGTAQLTAYAIPVDVGIPWLAR